QYFQPDRFVVADHRIHQLQIWADHLDRWRSTDSPVVAQSTVLSRGPAGRPPTMDSPSRRHVVQRIVTASLIYPFRCAPQPENAKVLRKAEISECDLSLLGDCSTPNDLFFVREHFPAPAIAAEKWKLEFTGAIASPFAISYEELLQQPRQTLSATLEC